MIDRTDVASMNGPFGGIGTIEAWKPKENAPEPKPNRRGHDPGYAPSKHADTTGKGVFLEDFNAYMPAHSYIYTPSLEMWPAVSVNARIPPVRLLDKKGEPILNKNGNQRTIPAATWIDKNRPVEQMTWAPGLPLLICNRLISDGGWIERDKVTCFNLYRPPAIKPGNAADVGSWKTRVSNVFLDDAEHIIKWLAHRVQCPQEKINHALVLGGYQGVGKDTLLEPVKRAIGPWNFSEVSPGRSLAGSTAFSNPSFFA